MDRNNANKFFVYCLCFVCLIVFFIPFSRIYSEEGSTMGNYTLKNSYLYEDIISFYVYLSFILFLGIFLFVKNRILQNVSKLLILIISGFISFLAVNTFMILAQDFSPSWGLLLSILLFPLTLGVILTNKTKSVNKNGLADNILDA